MAVFKHSYIDPWLCKFVPGFVAVVLRLDLYEFRFYLQTLWFYLHTLWFYLYTLWFSWGNMMNISKSGPRCSTLPQLTLVPDISLYSQTYQFSPQDSKDAYSKNLSVPAQDNCHIIHLSVKATLSNLRKINRSICFIYVHLKVTISSLNM